MAKKRKTVIGSVVKGRDGKPDYIKVRGTHVLKDGQFLNLETKDAQLASAEAAFVAKKLSAEVLGKIKDRVGKIPDFVRFEVTTLEDQE